MLTIVLSIIILALFFFFGASLGSFLGVVIERVPKKENINGRSHCACGRQLTWYENIPVVGWLRVKGKTKCCNTKIPVWYLYLELATGIIGLAVGIFFIQTLV